MPCDETENDAEIARLLSEDYMLESHGASETVPVKAMEVDDIQDASASSSLNGACAIDGTRTQIEEDADIAFLLQIDEIIALENQTTGDMTQPTDAQLEKTHATITHALESTENTSVMTRIVGMVTVIHTRFAQCQTKNESLIEQLRKLTLQYGSVFLPLKAGGNRNIPKTAAPHVLLTLLTNVLQNKTMPTEARETMNDLFRLWNDSSIWYEFLEQLVYILVAITIPAFGQLAMGKLTEKISAAK